MIYKFFIKSKREEGVQILSILLIIIFIVLIYLGIISWRPILGFSYIKDTMADAVKPGYFKNKSDYVPTENEVRNAIIETANSWKLPITSRNIRIQRNNQNVTATVDYNWTFNFLGFEYVKQFSYTTVGENVK
jgi:hypothetical protein